MIHTLSHNEYPESLRNIKYSPPQLFIKSKGAAGFQKLMKLYRVAVVGTRKISPYGQSVTNQLAGELAARGIVIVSGLAIGVDACAHEAALEAEGLTMAVLPAPVERVQPRMHDSLAKRIVEADGALVSEYPADSQIFRPNFVARNRIVTGLADALLITEAAENSGTMHTARFALEQGTTVMAVPGNINSPMSAGTNNLIKTGATPVTSVYDVLHTLGFKTARSKDPITVRVRGGNPDEQLIIDLLEQGISDGGEILSASGLSISDFNHNLTMLEITAKVRALGANHWALS